MPAIIRTEWAGTTGGPGLTQMCIATMENWTVPIDSAGQTAVDAVRTFWNSIAGLLPNELTLTVSPQIDQYDTLTGDLEFTMVVATPPLPVLGTSAAIYAGGAGAKVTWETGVIANGRRVRGSTFIVPIGSNAYTTTGTITGAAQTTINNAASTLRTALEPRLTNLGVWSRPKTVPVPTSGAFNEVTSGLASSKTAILRSRRD